MLTKTHHTRPGETIARLCGIFLVTVLFAGALTATASAVTSGQALPNGYPRLTDWWNAQDGASSANVARYDLIIGGGYQAWQLPQIRAINPDIVALWAGSACEVSYDPNGNADFNSDLSPLPAQWILTQAGSKLSTAVDASTKTFPVTATAAGSKSLFRVGDSVVIDDEVAYVEAVGMNSLTVRRGVLKAATAHGSGTRVASVCTWYPQTVMMDLTASCPRITVDSNVGPETWAQYNARFGALRVSQGPWDGIFVDRSDGDEAWIIDGTRIRTIDADRSNTLVTDYSAFNTAWNAGLRTYEQALHADMGANKIVFSNQATPNYDLLNGTAFEDFPGGGQWTGWHDVLYGPTPRYSGSQATYLDWTSQAAQPNLTTVIARQGAGAVDYKRLRFGLGTALMGDGFYAYEISNSSNQIWADEFDGGGLGRGYLGKPKSGAVRAMPTLTSADLLSGHGSLDTAQALSAWKLEKETGYTGSATLDTATKISGAASAKVVASAVGGTDWKLAFSHPVAVKAGSDYTLTFSAKADRALNIGAFVQQTSSPYAIHTWIQTSIPVTTQWQTFEIPCTSSGTDPAAMLRFALGASAGTVWIDNVKMQAGANRDILRRDFDNGIALVNGSSKAVTVDLGGTFSKIDGNQDRTVNDGRSVTAVTLQANDGVVLLRPPATPGPTAPPTPDPAPSPDPAVAPAPQPEPRNAVPTGDFVLANGVSTLTTTAVDVAADVTGAARMRVTIDSDQPAAWTDYASVSQVRLPPVSGTHQVRIEFASTTGDTLSVSHAIYLALPKLTLAGPTKPVKPHTRTRLTGIARVSPVQTASLANAGIVVALERLTTDGWSTEATTTTRFDGSYAFDVQVDVNSRYRACAVQGLGDQPGGVPEANVRVQIELSRVHLPRHPKVRSRFSIWGTSTPARNTLKVEVLHAVRGHWRSAGTFTVNSRTNGAWKATMRLGRGTWGFVVSDANTARTPVSAKPTILRLP